ncbi:MAG: fimbrillin family protein, partial [Fermentimonas sp.]|nr:fimbrillin family protein [Fermentimonas sp.]
MLRLNSFKCNVRNSALALGLILTAGLSSCEEKGLDLYGENREDVEATFITTIRPSTRMSDDKWESGDAIGVFAISNGEILSDSSIYNNYKNIKYINKSDGSIANFEAAETAIKYPDTKEMLDFTAYYPYTDTGYIGGNDFSLSVDISQQSPHSAIDILYAKATGYNRDNPEVDLHFTHSLSQFCLNITASEEISLEGVEINIINAVTQGVMNLKDGTVTPSEISG